MDWKELSSAPTPPTPSHAFPTFQWGPSSKSMPQAEVLDQNGGERSLVFCKVKAGRGVLEVWLSPTNGAVAQDRELWRGTWPVWFGCKR